MVQLLKRTEDTTERPVAFLSQIDWREWLIGPYVVELWSNSDGTGEELRFRSLIVDLTFKDVSGISQEQLAELFGTVSPEISNGES